MNETTKERLKLLISLVVGALVFPVYGLFALLSLLGDKDHAFWSFSQGISLFPGKLGSYLRRSFYRLAMTSCDSDCAIMFGTLFSQADTEIGKGVYIGPNCNIGRCKIEDYCTLGSNVHIMSGHTQHRFGDLGKPIQEQGGTFEKVVIGEDTWIGNGALIMANLGRKCVVGAGSVVTKNMPACSIVAGNPAKVLRQRHPLKVVC